MGEPGAKITTVRMNAKIRGMLEAVVTDMDRKRRPHEKPVSMSTAINVLIAQEHEARGLGNGTAAVDPGTVPRMRKGIRL